ncbi:RING finger protein nhl-1-like [Lutzomyia longipalpis]|uniref:RING finger protein nhl-1-like n=1 Tax=Lutzomyia longipalpis TaxID=7200 RepID=UPI002483BC53|nr:RING finger protein nhl-1-like [Lutzomyia longipalpis]
MNSKNPPAVILRSKSMRFEQRGSLAPLEDLVQCGICFDRLQNPKMLACQHTFCHGCLEAIYGNSTKTTRECPTCRTTFTSQLNEIPTNLYICSLLKLLGNDSVSLTSAALSGQLERCVKCDMVPDPISNMDNDNFFRKCSHCRLKFCQICWTSHMSDLTNQLTNLSDQLKSAEECLTHKLANIKDQMVQVRSHMSQFVERQVQELRERELRAVESAEQMVEHASMKYQTIVDAIDGTKRDLNVKISQMEPDHEASTYFLQMHKKVSDILQDISKWDDIRMMFNEDEFRIEMNTTDVGEHVEHDEESPDAEDNPLEDKTSLVKYIISRNFKPKLSWTKCPRPLGVFLAPWTDEIVGEQLLYIAGSDSKIVFAIERKKGRIIHRIFHEEMIYPHSIAISSDSQEIFVSDKWKHCIFVFSRHGVLERVIGSKGDFDGYLRSPEGIALGPENTIYICDTGNDRIQCLNRITGQMIMQFGQVKKTPKMDSSQQNTISTPADLQSPTAVALHAKHIIVLDSGHCRVKIFNRMGEKISEFGKMGTQKGQFRYPEVLTIGPYGFIFLGDSGNSRVQIFSQSGRLIKTIGGRGSSAGLFKWISGIHVTPDLEVIVTDYKNHSVQIFH